MSTVGISLKLVRGGGGSQADLLGGFQADLLGGFQADLLGGFQPDLLGAGFQAAAQGCSSPLSTPMSSGLWGCMEEGAEPS